MQECHTHARPRPDFISSSWAGSVGLVLGSRVGLGQAAAWVYGCVATRSCVYAVQSQGCVMACRTLARQLHGARVVQWCRTTYSQSSVPLHAACSSWMHGSGSVLHECSSMKPHTLGPTLVHTYGTTDQSELNVAGSQHGAGGGWLHGAMFTQLHNPGPCGWLVAQSSGWLAVRGTWQRQGAVHFW